MVYVSFVIVTPCAKMQKLRQKTPHTQTVIIHLKKNSYESIYESDHFLDY